MVSTVCPQRIIKEAIRLLENATFATQTANEEADNTIIELGELERALFAQGINAIRVNSGE